MTKAEKAEVEALRSKIRELEGANAVLRKSVQIKNPVGSVLLEGYGDEPLPLGPLFRVSIVGGQSDGMEVCVQHGLLSVRSVEGAVLALPAASNVMNFVNGQLLNAGVLLKGPRP